MLISVRSTHAERSTGAQQSEAATFWFLYAIPGGHIQIWADEGKFLTKHQSWVRFSEILLFIKNPNASILSKKTKTTQDCAAICGPNVQIVRGAVVRLWPF